MSEIYTGIKTVDGRDVLTYEYIERLRAADAKKSNPYKIVAQKGGQENMLASSADILIGGGAKGGSKTYSILLNGLSGASNRFYRGTIFRKEKDSLTDIIETSKGIYSDFGDYNKSKDDMTWNFNNGALLKFNYYSDPLDDFKARMQGRQYAFVAVDEITHMEFEKFKTLTQNNRNAYGMKNQFWGTCNPDPDSWVARFIDPWIGEDGLPIPEMDGKTLYCFMGGETVNDVIWGRTRDEVYEQCRGEIEKAWRDEFAEFGSPQDLFIKSVCFVAAKINDNKQLLRSSPDYLGTLVGLSDEERSRFLDGNWKFKAVGDDIIKMHHMEAFFSNAHQLGDNVRRATCDIAFDGGDNLVLWLWIGWHIVDVFVCRADAPTTVNNVKAKLKEWGVLEENFTYDLNGIGQIFKGYFNSSMPFNNRESVAEEDKGLYDTVKSQSAYLFAKKIKNKEISIEEELLDLRFKSGKNENVPLKQILMNERKIIKADDLSADKGFCLIKKAVMKKIIGKSPDFFEALFMRMIFEIKKKKKGKPKWNARYITQPRYY